MKNIETKSIKFRIESLDAINRTKKILQDNGIPFEEKNNYEIDIPKQEYDIVISDLKNNHLNRIMINARTFDEKTLLSLLKSNNKFNEAVMHSNSFNEIKDLLDNDLQITYRESQLKYIEHYYNEKTK